MLKYSKKILLLSAIFITCFMPSISFALERVCIASGACCKENIIKLANASKETIEFVTDEFNDRDIYDALSNAIGRGISVTIFTDKEKIKSSKYFAALLADLNALGAVVKYKINTRTIFKQNFGLFDQKVIITGNYNPTYDSEIIYEVDCLLIDEDAIVSHYNYYVESLMVSKKLAEFSYDEFNEYRDKLAKQPDVEKEKPNESNEKNN